VSDVFVVKTAAAAANPALQALHVTTATQGLTVTTDSHSDIAFTDQAGHSIYSASAPTMWDSVPMPSSVIPATDGNGSRSTPKPVCR
jgi:hypothetical protein